MNKSFTHAFLQSSVLLGTLSKFCTWVLANIWVASGAETMAKAFQELCCDGDLDAVMRAALQRGVDLNGKDQNGRTGLMLSLMENQKEVASYLLDQENIDINIVSDWGETALHWVAWRDNRGIAHICYISYSLKSPILLQILQPKFLFQPTLTINCLG